MVFFCLHCWKEIPERAICCPACGVDLAQEDARPFVEKSCAALRHPEPQTAVRAAWILGERRDKAAVPELIHVLETTEDGFLAEAAADALGKIGDETALSPRAGRKKGTLRA